MRRVTWTYVISWISALRVFGELLETEPDHPVALAGKMEIEPARGSPPDSQKTE